MSILDDDSNTDVLAWMPDGDSFTIVNHRLFVMDRMHKLFSIRNMSSFVRKLSRWGFSRLHEKSTRNSDIFKHKLFLRGRQDLVKRIRCVYRPTLKPDLVTPGVVSPVVEESSLHLKEPQTLAMPLLSEPHAQRPTFTPNRVQGPAFMNTMPVPTSQLRIRRVSECDLPFLPSASGMPSSMAMYSPAPSHNMATIIERERAFEQVTSRVVSAAIETLRRDTPVSARHRQEQDLLALRSAQEATMFLTRQQRPMTQHTSGPSPWVQMNQRGVMVSHISAPFPQTNTSQGPVWMRVNDFSF
jgi:hypothetical protein